METPSYALGMTSRPSLLAIGPIFSLMMIINGGEDGVGEPAHAFEITKRLRMEREVLQSEGR